MRGYSKRNDFTRSCFMGVYSMPADLYVLLNDQLHKQLLCPLSE